MTKYGAANYTTRDGEEARVAGYGAYSLFPPELIMLAGTYILLLYKIKQKNVTTQAFQTCLFSVNMVASPVRVMSPAKSGCQKGDTYSGIP
ncbi:MAG: hypothetical protein ACYCX4_18585 [Bacillota bacterium]